MKKKIIYKILLLHINTNWFKYTKGFDQIKTNSINNGWEKLVMGINTAWYSLLFWTEYNNCFLTIYFFKYK